ncbi:MAG: hypothetical protein MI923_24215 [Phycisphaerales bacterium]|nr:hypothetical protein [Phycisphaerales bacterium]
MRTNKPKEPGNRRHSRSHVSLVLMFASSGLMALSSCMVPITMLPGTVTILFDGAEGTVDGDTDFTFEGANFTGGTVRTVGNPFLYGSGRFAYEVRAGSTVIVTFDTPINLLELVFILRGGGTTVLRALDATGNEVGTLNAGNVLEAQMVELSGDAVRVEVTHTGDGDGWIDNFTFRPT